MVSDFLQELNSSYPSTPQVQIWDILPMQLCCQGWRVVPEHVQVWNECYLHWLTTAPAHRVQNHCTGVPANDVGKTAVKGRVITPNSKHVFCLLRGWELKVTLFNELFQSFKVEHQTSKAHRMFEAEETDIWRE